MMPFACFAAACLATVLALRNEDPSPSAADRPAVTGDAPDREAPRPKPPSPIDQELLRSLEKQTAVEPEQHPLERIGQRMRSVRDRLARADAGEQTRTAQQEIVKDIERLIEELKKGGQDSGSSSSSKQEKRSTSGASQPSQGPPSDQPASDSDPGRTATPRPPDGAGERASDSRAMVREVWGHLPDKLKEEMQQAFKEFVLPRYETMIDQYFRTIAEQGGRKNR